MRNDQIFVLLLVILLPMTGCFDGAVGDAEGTDDASENGDTSGGEGTSTGTASSTQARSWYSSAGSYHTYWNDGQSGEYIDNYGNPQNILNSGERCVDWGPLYNSSTGEYVGEECVEYRRPNSASDWNLTDCTDNGGEAVWSYDVETLPEYYQYAPTCRTLFSTINTSVGEALLIYEMSYFTLSSTCDGVSVSTITSALTGKEYVIAPGTALSCSHELYAYRTYTYTEQNIEQQRIWSIVYAIQDATVV